MKTLIMKKFMQSCAIAALIMIVLGFAMAAISGTFIGKEAVRNIVVAAKEGKLQLDPDAYEEWGNTVGESFGEEIGDLGESLGEGVGNLGQAIGDGIAEGMGDVTYDLEDSMIFDDDFEIFTGDAEKYSLGNNVEELDVEVGGCTFDIEFSEDSDYYVEARSTKKFQRYVKDGILYIKASSVNAGDDGRIVLYVPADWKVKKADIEIGAGDMTIEGIWAEEIDLEVGAGQITIDEVIADTLEANVGMGEILMAGVQVEKLQGEVGMGHLYVEGAIGEKAEVECSMGSLEMVIEGVQEDFNYDIECGMGNINVGDSQYTGIAEEKNVDNDASKKMSIECAMGDVSISFAE